VGSNPTPSAIQSRVFSTNPFVSRKVSILPLNTSEKLGMQALPARSHLRMARELELSGSAVEAKEHYKEASQIAAIIQEEADADTITRRSDLSPIFAHPS
jgi:hypothetical protein